MLPNHNDWRRSATPERSSISAGAVGIGQRSCRSVSDWRQSVVGSLIGLVALFGIFTLRQVCSNASWMGEPIYCETRPSDAFLDHQE